jgi:major intracellular serine protease
MKATLTKNLFRRTQPGNNTPSAGHLDAGSVIEVLEKVKGEFLDGINDWYRAADGFFYWAGGVELEKNVNLATEITITKKDWGFVDFKIDELWKFSRGQGIKVAILDSGLNYNLTDFKDKPGITYYNAVLDSDLKEHCQDDSYGHGTDCSAILCATGATLFGVAPDCSLLVVKITNEAGERDTKSILKGLSKAIAFNPDVISLSFSLAKDENFDSIHNLIKTAYAGDITILAAAGDSGGLGFPVDNFPASFPECLSIGGIDRNKKRSRASSKSNFLDLMGPGEALFSVTNPANKISGTSYSTPFAAGVIALLKAIAKNQNKTLHNIGLFDILKRSADINTGTTYNILDYGWGILDPLAALKLLLAQ